MLDPSSTFCAGIDNDEVEEQDAGANAAHEDDAKGAVVLPLRKTENIYNN
jgi:hypothetical protein